MKQHDIDFSSTNSSAHLIGECELSVPKRETIEP